MQGDCPLHTHTHTHGFLTRQLVTKASRCYEGMPVFNVGTGPKELHFWTTNPRNKRKWTTSYGSKSHKATWPGLTVGGVKGILDNRRRSPVFGWGGVGQRMAREHRDSGKSGGPITALSLCLPLRTFLNKAQTQGLMTSATLALLLPHWHLLAWWSHLSCHWAVKWSDSSTTTIKKPLALNALLLLGYDLRQSNKYFSYHPHQLCLSFVCCTTTQSSQMPQSAPPFTNPNHNTTNQAQVWQDCSAEPLH